MASRHVPERLSPRAAALRLGITDWAVRRYCEAHPHIARRIKYGPSRAGWSYDIDLDALAAVIAAHPRMKWSRPPAERAMRSQEAACAGR